MSGRRLHWLRHTCFAAAAFALTACSARAPAATSRAATASPALAALQQGTFLNTTLYGIIDYQWQGQVFSWPTTLTAPSVPIIWMGHIFSADLQQIGNGKDMSIQVHGSTSNDGAWVNTLSYSKRIVYQDTIPNRVVFYQVTLRNIPLTAAAATANITATFDQRGAELWKYVAKIEYVQGAAKDGTIAPDATFKSIDWQNDTGGQPPRLNLVFEKMPSESLIADSPAGGSNGMGP